MITKKLLSLSNLTRDQAFCIYKSTQVVVVYKDEELIFAAFQKVVLSLEYFNNG